MFGTRYSVLDTRYFKIFYFIDDVFRFCPIGTDIPYCASSDSSWDEGKIFQSLVSLFDASIDEFCPWFSRSCLDKYGIVFFTKDVFPHDGILDDDAVKIFRE